MKMIEVICAGCGSSYLKQKKEVTRQLKDGQNKFYCSIPCYKKHRKKTEEIYNLVCENCGEQFSSKVVKKCCSRKCSNTISRKVSIERNPEFYNKIAIKTKENWKNGRYKKQYKYLNRVDGKAIYRKGVCEICKKEFDDLQLKPKKTCSEDCYRLLVSKNSSSNPNCGGESNYKKFYYKNIFMDSSWEVEIAKFLDEKNIKWERSHKLVFKWTDDKKRKRRYHPDFYLPEFDIYLEPKNKFLLERDALKLKRVIEENGITLIYGLKDFILDEIKRISENKQFVVQ